MSDRQGARSSGQRGRGEAPSGLEGGRALRKGAGVVMESLERPAFTAEQFRGLEVLFRRPRAPSSVRGPPAFPVPRPLSLSCRGLPHLTDPCEDGGRPDGPVSSPRLRTPDFITSWKRTHSQGPALGRGCLWGSLFCHPQGPAFSGGCREPLQV